MMRIGQGFDVHALVPGRRLVLGGVEIEHVVEGQRLGLLGHSDADVLLHAVTDAVLGAAGLGDIGRLFPDSDPAHRDADSWQLLRSKHNCQRSCDITAFRVQAIGSLQRLQGRPRLPT